MLRAFARSFGDNNASLRRRICAFIALLVFANVFAWLVAIFTFRSLPSTLSLCALAYSFGLRHAVDADHIAAIDNVTRKLMQQGQRPLAVGFFFSLGHSTIVVVLCVIVAVSTGFAKDHLHQLQAIGGIIGTCVSATFLYILALINLVIFIRVFRTFREVRRGNPVDDHALEDLFSGGGLLARIIRPVFRLVSRSWHMYPVGFLFGLGFDTASEVALLGISATQAAKSLSVWSILVFPLLFTVGMCLIDTVDGIVMLGAYGWAFINPMRKLFYNMTITLVSFLVAFGIGTLELLTIVASEWDLQNGPWAWINTISDHSTFIGYFIIAFLIGSWILAVVIYRVAGLDDTPGVKPATIDLEYTRSTTLNGESCVEDHQS